MSWTRDVDRKIFYPKPRVSNQNPVLLCVSRVSKEKNLEDFFRLYYGPVTRKIMVGDGPMREQYQQQYPDVEFVGFKTGKDLADYYRMADVFVFPSQWETFGIVMIEAMACGTPVAAFPVQGLENVIDQGITGYLASDLRVAIDQCLTLDRNLVTHGSQRKIE